MEPMRELIVDQLRLVGEDWGVEQVRLAAKARKGGIDDVSARFVWNRALLSRSNYRLIAAELRLESRAVEQI